MRTRLRMPLFAALLPLVAGRRHGCSTRAGQGGLQGRQQASTRKRTTGRRSTFYERAVELDPDLAEAHFYLGSSHQSLYRPGKEGDENKQHLDQAIAHYEKSLEVNKAGNPNLQAAAHQHARRAHRHVLGPAAHELREGARLRRAAREGQPERRQEPVRDGEPVREVRPRGRGGADLRQGDRAEPERREGVRRARGFYNKPLWDEAGAVFVENQSKGPRRAKFSSAIATLEKCAKLDATDPSGYYKLAMFYWDKAYRDPLIDDKEKDEYADKGLAARRQGARHEARLLGGDHHEGPAVPREGPGRHATRSMRKEYLDKAVLLQKQAMDLRKETAGRSCGRPTRRAAGGDRHPRGPGSNAPGGSGGRDAPRCESRKSVGSFSAGP